jgi:hypothetical protein
MRYPARTLTPLDPAGLATRALRGHALTSFPPSKRVSSRICCSIGAVSWRYLARRHRTWRRMECWRYPRHPFKARLSLPFQVSVTPREPKPDEQRCALSNEKALPLSSCLVSMNSADRHQNVLLAREAAALQSQSPSRKRTPPASRTPTRTEYRAGRSSQPDTMSNSDQIRSERRDCRSRRGRIL